MITKILDENTISLMPEDSDDLLTVRRILKNDEKIIGETTRVIKQEKEYSRPDKGERIRVRLAIKVEKISLDNVLDRIRVGGTILESNNESVPHGTHQSFTKKIDDKYVFILSFIFNLILIPYTFLCKFLPVELQMKKYLLDKIIGPDE